MKGSIVLGIIQNVAILLTFAMMYNYFWTKADKSRKWYLQLVSGSAIGAIGIVLMLTPWTLYPGLIFDTRSILLAISGLFFGAIPTITAIIITSAYRIFIGGDGILMGVAVIVSSGFTGIIWRQLRKPVENKHNILELFLLGFIVHAIMLGCTLFLPDKTALLTLKNIFWPVLIIYPLGTIFLGALMYRQTKNRLMQSALNESEKRWKFALEGSGYGVWDWDNITHEVFFSHQWKAMLGYEDNEIKNNFNEWDSRLHPEDRDRVIKDLTRFLSGEINFYTVEHRLLCKNGNYKWILARGKIISRTANNKPHRIIGTHTDISSRKKFEEIIRHNKIRNQIILNTAMDGFWIANTKGVIIEINEMYANISGYNRNELIGKHISDLEANNDKKIIKQRIEHIIRTGTNQFESIHKKKNGQLWHVELSIKYLNIDEGIIVSFIKDITEKKAAELELKKHREHLEELVKDRTKNLEEKNAELEKFSNLFIDREIRIMELKNEIKRIKNNAKT